MKEIETIRELKRHIQYLRETWKPHPDYNVIEALNEAIYALEKQVARKPKITSKVEDCEYIRCTNCNLTTVLYGGMRPNYCANCGQKLDWSDEE